jgi:hypothetical protein
MLVLSMKELNVVFPEGTSVQACLCVSRYFPKCVVVSPLKTRSTTSRSALFLKLATTFFTTSPPQPHQSTQQCCLTLLSHAITSSLLPAIGFCSVSTFSSGAQIITLWLLVTTAPFYLDLCHILEIHLDSHINYYHEKNSRSS